MQTRRHYLQPGETYRVDVSMLNTAQEEHPHERLKIGRDGSEREFHIVTVESLGVKHTVRVRCECGAGWQFEDSGFRSDVTRQKGTPPKKQTVGGTYKTRRRSEQRKRVGSMDRLAERDDRRAQALSATEDLS